jgi:hypothetical protein
MCVGGSCEAACPAGKSCPGDGIVNWGEQTCCAADQQCCCAQVDEGVHQQYSTGGCVAFQCAGQEQLCGGTIGSACHPDSVYGCCCGLQCLGYQTNPNRYGTCRAA